MHDHHLIVLNLSLKIADKIPCDQLVLKIGALLHDIGKVYKADEKTLMEKHDVLGWEVSGDFLQSLNIKENQLEKIKQIWDRDKTNTEKQIISDADILAFYIDRKLQNAFKKWAKKKDYKYQMQRKMDGFNLLHLEISKEIGEPLLEEFKKHWMKDI